MDFDYGGIISRTEIFLNRRTPKLNSFLEIMEILGKLSIPVKKLFRIFLDWYSNLAFS